MFKLGLIFTYIALGVSETNSAYLSLDSFFNTNGNLAIITWAQEIHSVNALSLGLNSNAMMLEGEVSLGEYNGTNFAPSALIMGTSLGTDYSSDLTVLQFLNSVQIHNMNTGNHTRKGVQLNFRNLFVLEAALIPLLTTIPRLDFPVWLHTEILQGPNGSLLFMDAKEFLDLVIGFRNATLSLTWTLAPSIGLNNTDIDTMVRILQDNSVDKAVTFPIRADIAALSVSQLQNLINRVPNSTLTIWGNAPMFNNIATTNSIRNILINIGLNRTLLVVPDNIRTTLLLNLTNSSGIISLSMICLLLIFLANLI